MRRLRVLVLAHEELVPPANAPPKEPGVAPPPWQTERDVIVGLRKLGHEVRVVGVAQDLDPLRRVVAEWEPHIIFNQLVEFQDVGAFQVHIVSYLELLGVPYTGCNPGGILLTGDKPLAKKILRYHRVPTPEFLVYPRGRSPRGGKRRSYPLIVKAVGEDASLGISQASIVRNPDELQDRVKFVHESLDADAIVEEYIPGRELTIGLLGNHRVKTFPIWEMVFENLPDGSEPIATAHIKWNREYQKRLGIKTRWARDLPGSLEERIPRLARRSYRALNLSGFARIDLRLTPDGRVFVIEVNACPDLTRDEDFAESAAAAGIPYPTLLQRILNLGLAYRPPWKPA